jgi:hypothetical protein
VSNGQEHTVESARAASERDDLKGWVARFLASPGSDNALLAEHLGKDLGWWVGPVQVPLDQLNRLAGPPGAPVLEEVEDHEWRDDVDELAEQIEDGEADVAPVIVAHRDDQLVLEDGNHRVEALRRAGHDEAWAVVGFESAADRDRFLAARS